jgi:ATP-dependent Lon protease
MAKRRLLQIRETELEKLAILELPVLPVRDTVLFPHMMAPLIVGRAHSIRAIEEALASERSIIVVAQKVLEMTEIEPDNLYNVGTEAVIGRILRLPDGTTSVLVQGQQRVRILEFVEGGPYLQARALPIPEPTDKPKPVEALIREVLSSFEKMVQLSRHLGNDAYVAALNIDEPGWLADFIISSLELPVAQRQEILEALDPATRLQKVGIILAKQLDIMELESQIHTQVQQQVDKSQREYFLREQLMQIQKELGETDAQARQYNELKEKIEAAAMPEGANTKAMEELERLSQQPPMSPEVGMIRTYLDWLIALP